MAKTLNDAERGAERNVDIKAKPIETKTTKTEDAERKKEGGTSGVIISITDTDEIGVKDILLRIKEKEGGFKLDQKIYIK